MIPRSTAWRGTGGDREAPTPAERLERLARQIRNLSPDWRDPRRFYERRDDLAAEATRVAADLPPVALRR